MIKINAKDFGLPNIDNYDVYICNLKDFPKERYSNTVDGENGKINFYTTDKNIKVLSMSNTGKLSWKTPTYWSEHPDRLVEIVNLSYGLQIITDNDPRAVFGITYENLKRSIREEIPLKFERFTPTQALEKKVLVPVLSKTVKDIRSNKNDINIRLLNKNIKSLNDAINACVSAYIQYRIILNVTHANNKWELINAFDVEADKAEFNDFKSVYTFAQVRSVEYTNAKETGYDLTVPNYETFCNAYGTILSNTINVHVPALPEAVDDVKNKLMPSSQQIFSIRDPEKIVNLPKQEFILGAFGPANAKPEHKWIFNSYEDMFKALKEGKIKLSDEFTVVS